MNNQSQIEVVAPNPEIVGLLTKIIELNADVVDQNRRILLMLETPQITVENKVDPDFLKRLRDAA